MREELILEALDMAVSDRDIQPNTLLHSERGVQNRCHDYQTALNDYGSRCSMSRTGSCWDNAVVESFFSRLKVELIYAENYQTVTQVHSGILEYIEVFYNRQRRHSAIGYMSPHDYEQHYERATAPLFVGKTSFKGEVRK